MSIYPDGSIRSILGSDNVSAATRTALQRRMDSPPPLQCSVFTPHHVTILRAVCDCLIPPTSANASIDIPSCIERRLAAGHSDGWRYDTMPSDVEAYRSGLEAFDDLARNRTGRGFVELPRVQQARLLDDVQHERLGNGEWGGPHPARFFEELLVECVEVYYSHPIASEEIGYLGMADVHGWELIGLNEREIREPSEQ